MFASELKNLHTQASKTPNPKPQTPPTPPLSSPSPQHSLEDVEDWKLEAFGRVPMAAGKASGSSSILATRQALPIFQLKNDFLRAVRRGEGGLGQCGIVTLCR